MAKNVLRNPGFEQVCVWPGACVGPTRIEEFEQFMLQEFLFAIPACWQASGGSRTSLGRSTIGA